MTGLDEPKDRCEALVILGERQVLQDQIDAANLWELDRSLEIACDAMRLPPGDAKIENLSVELQIKQKTLNLLWNSKYAF